MISLCGHIEVEVIAQRGSEADRCVIDPDGWRTFSSSSSLV